MAQVSQQVKHGGGKSARELAKQEEDKAKKKEAAGECNDCILKSFIILDEKYFCIHFLGTPHNFDQRFIERRLALFIFNEPLFD